MNLLGHVRSHFDLSHGRGRGLLIREGGLGEAVSVDAPASGTRPPDPIPLGSVPPRPDEGRISCGRRLTAGVILLHYLALTLGVLAKFFIQFTHGASRLNWLTLVSALILSAVIYPHVYKRVYDPDQNCGLQYFVSFQSGFFFQTLLEEIQNTLS